MKVDKKKLQIQSFSMRGHPWASPQQPIPVCSAFVVWLDKFPSKIFIIQEKIVWEVTVLLL
jgi:hypothetical protein